MDGELTRGDSSLDIVKAEDASSAGFQVVSSATVAFAVHRVLHQLYLGQSLPTHPVTGRILTEEERNTEIYQRYVIGGRAIDLAEDYRVSLQRIYVLIRRYHGAE
jgi:Mor family transcriptional regulator